jgi:fumarate reductase flavoprotein subunit
MGHLGPDNVRRQFKGMVERCADCGFDLASGLVEVVPTAHYMMGGVEFTPECRTALAGLFAAGEDTGGVHGANRLGGNGVANSTVFGAIAGDAMAAWTRAEGEWRDPDPAALESACARALAPIGRAAGGIEPLREELYRVMWNDVGILRDAAGLTRAEARLGELRDELGRIGIAGKDLRYNLTWHDWLNLESLITVSRAICSAARARAESRGAHFREDFPQTDERSAPSYSRVRLEADRFEVGFEPVRFTRVRPGETLIAA